MITGRGLVRPAGAGAVAGLLVGLALALAPATHAQRPAPALLWGPAASSATVIVAFVDGAACETANVGPDDGGFRWFVQIDQGECGARAGSVVSFTVDGREASETAVWESGPTTRLELTVPDEARDPAVEPPPTAATSPEGEPPETGTVTTSLHPGWNLVGWVGPPTPASELFAAIPELTAVYAWDREARRYRGAARSAGGSGLGQIARGQGLWLRVGGGQTVEWARPLSREGRLVSLRPGLNLVVWTGRDQIPAQEALARLGDALGGASLWNPGRQEYERYDPHAADGAVAPPPLRHGDALWLDVTARARWWQPGTATPRLVTLGEVPPTEESAARAELEAMEAFFAEHFDTGAVDYTVYIAADWPSAEERYREIFYWRDSPSSCLDYTIPAVLFVILPCEESLSSLAWLHFWNLQEQIAPRANPFTPGADGVHPQGADWLHLGTREFAHYAYIRSIQPERGHQLYGRLTSSASRAGESLREIESQARTHYLLSLLSAWEARGFLAAEWLAERAGAPALLDYYRVAESSRDWRHAFERAFGLDLERFYGVVDPYINEIAPPIPHLADDRDEPVLVLSGDIAPEAAAAVRADFEAAQRFFSERLGAGGADYTVYVAADDESAAPAFRKAFSRDPDPGFCFTASQGSALMMTLDCGRTLAHHLGRYHYINAQSSIPREAGFLDDTPIWLRDGFEQYARYAFLAEAGPETPDQIRSRLAGIARGVVPPLPAFERTYAEVPVEHTLTLFYFAAEWLVERAGENAIFDYQRRRSPSESWQATFESIFDITVEDFYEAFEAYRVDLATPPPPAPPSHLAGEVPPARVSAADGWNRATATGTITTVLHPGWNAVGWVGPDASTSDLFQAVPALQGVALWEPSAQRYRLAWRGSGDRPLAVRPGTGVWMYVGGDAPAPWTRPALADGLVVRLQTGRNLVGVVADGAVSLPDGRDVRAWRWDPSRQRYQPYWTGHASLREGDALWIEVPEPLNWWQPGTADPPFLFVGDVPIEDRRAILGEYDDVRRFFAEHFAAATRGRTRYIAADVEAARPMYLRQTGREPPDSLCRWSHQGIEITVLGCLGPPRDTFGDDYLRELWSEIPGIGRQRRGVSALDGPGPGWLLEGAREYALTSYREARGGPVSTHRSNMEDGARRTSLPLSYFEGIERRDAATSFSEAGLGFLAVEWLAERAGDPAVFRYLALVRTAEDWRETLQAVFGISVDDFYAAFAAVRAEAFPLVPELTVGVTGPAVVFLGDVEVDTRSAMRAESVGTYTMLAERFGADPFEFTFFVATDKEWFRHLNLPLVSDRWLRTGEGSCSYRNSPESVLLLTVRCYEAFPEIAHRNLLDAALAELAPSGSLPAQAGHDRRGPMWLLMGTESYTRDAYLQATGDRAPGESRYGPAFAAASAPQPLSSMESVAAVNAARDQVVALGFLAVDWLVEWAGEPALLEYHRSLPSSTSWHAAFESAFGLTIEDFYERFEAYRATLR